MRSRPWRFGAPATATATLATTILTITILTITILATAAFTTLGSQAIAQVAGHVQMLEPEAGAAAQVPPGTTNDGKFNFCREGSSDGSSAYAVAMSYQSGAVDVVQITPVQNYGSGMFPDLGLAARFAPAGVNFNAPNYSGQSSYRGDFGLVLIQWRIWNINGTLVQFNNFTQGADGPVWKKGQLLETVWSIRAAALGIPAGSAAATPATTATVNVGALQCVGGPLDRNALYQQLVATRQAYDQLLSSKGPNDFSTQEALKQWMCNVKRWQEGQ